MERLKITKQQQDEAWLYDESAALAVPFELTAYPGGDVTLKYYPCAETLADEFIMRFGTDLEWLFSAEAVNFFVGKFEVFLGAHGFSLSPDSGDYYINYELCDVPECDTCEVVKLNNADEFIDLTDTDIDGLLSCGFLIYAAVVDGKIVAVANTGEPINGDTETAVEIGVDTAEEYRRKGYGKACVCGLVRELKQLGHTAIYECASKNTASVKLIESIGGKAFSRKMYAVGFRDK